MEQSAIRESGQSSKKLKIRVFCTTSFEGYHKWSEAPDYVRYLRDLHRHIFHVRCEKLVSHEERDVEFITLKQAISGYIDSLQYHKREEINTWSCETWARTILEHFNLDKVEVSEDDENGAVVEAITE